MKIFLSLFFHSTSLQSVLPNGYLGVQLHTPVVYPARVHGFDLVSHFGTANDVKYYV